MLYIKALLAFIIHHPVLAYGAIFLISLSESLALVGLIVSGTVIMFGASLAVAGAVSTCLAVFIFVIIAAMWGFIWLGPPDFICVHTDHQSSFGPKRTCFVCFSTKTCSMASLDFQFLSGGFRLSLKACMGFFYPLG